MGPKIKASRPAHAAETDAMFMSIGDGAIVTDSRAMISRINQPALDILGYTEDELLGKWLPETIIAEDAQGKALSSIERPIALAFLRGQSISTRTYYRRKDGSPVPVSLTVSPILVDDKPTGAIEVFRDISNELALERAKDEFVAIASHQLRTPATAVKQYVGLLLEGYADPLTDNQKLFLERAYESNERQLNIVQEILKITQLDLEKVILKLDDYDIRQVINDAIETVRPAFAKKNQKLVTRLPSQPVKARIDKNQLRVAVENLLENASNYSWKNRPIEVSVRRGKEAIFIGVKDEGVGIAKVDLPKLFQKFSRIPNSLSIEAGGTGLGLYWAYKIIELHSGYILVNSTPNKGTAFKIRLPAGL